MTSNNNTSNTSGATPSLLTKAGLRTGKWTQAGLRTGKWTQEETEYVAELIKEFEAGSLNIEESISLRRFLARALNSSPKRISKKFEGTMYNGKQIYKRKSSNLTPEEVDARRDNLKELEHKYQESLRVLELVEASRKPTSCSTAGATSTELSFLANSRGAIGATNLAALATEPPMAAASFPLSGLTAGSALSTEVRIAQLKAEIALASRALASSSAEFAAISAHAKASSSKRSTENYSPASSHQDAASSTGLLERSSQAHILAALSGGGVSSSAAHCRDPKFRGLASSLQGQMALNGLFGNSSIDEFASSLNGGTFNGASLPSSSYHHQQQQRAQALLPVAFSSLRAAQGLNDDLDKVMSQQQLGRWKRGLLHRGEEGDASYKRFKLL